LLDLAAIDGLTYIQAIDFYFVRNMETATLSSKFQVSIPKAVRERMGLTAGQQFLFIPRGDTLVLVPKRDLAGLRGSVQGADTSGTRDREDRY
jgi:AbrB family looped-hinge helix DNA binding protein